MCFLLRRWKTARNSGFFGPLFWRLGLGPAAAGRQIANMPDAGLHDVVAPQILVNGLGFRRRLYDDQ